MGFYPRRQLVLLLLLVGAGGLGVAVGQWRQTHPEMVERLEAIDREPAGAPVSTRPARQPPKKVGDDAEPVDVNRATAGELMRVPGIGPTLAARIVEARERDGPFASLDDLRRLRGVSRARLERLRPRLTAEDWAPP